MKGCQPLTQGEFDLVLGAFSGRFQVRDRLLFVLGSTTGFRISELLALHVRSVWSHDRPVQFVSVPRREMKGHRESRTVPLVSAVHPFLRAWIAELSLLGVLVPSCPLFLSRKFVGPPPPSDSFFSRHFWKPDPIRSHGAASAPGAQKHASPNSPAPQQLRPISRVQAYRIISRALVMGAGERPCNGTHTMRKTFASRVFNATGQNIFLTQQALAHASPASTVAYLDGCSDQVYQAIAEAAQTASASPQP